MKIIFKILSVIALTLSLASCDNKKETKEVPMGMISLDLAKYGKQFSMYVPDTISEKLKIKEQSWGALEIKVGKDFFISITEDPGDIELIKSDIKSNDIDVFKSFILQEPLTIAWQTTIAESPRFHFYSIQKIDKYSYVFSDVLPEDGSSFSKEAILKMVESAKQIQKRDLPE